MLALLLLLATTAHAQNQTQKYSEPCEEVSATWAAQISQVTGATVPAIAVPAKIAYECLQSVPVDTEGDLLEIAELKELLKFQSNLNYLKDGIKHHNEAVDILGGLDHIADGVKNRNYKSDYEVQLAIRQLFGKAQDNHLAWSPDITEPLDFLRLGGDLISLSKDGVSLPELYLFTDIAPGLGLFANSTNYTTSSISPLKSINGKDAVEYLNSIAPQANFHDPDVGYNRLFLEWPRVAIKAEDLDGNSQSPFTKPKIYDGPITTFEFKNGSTKTIQNLAQIRSVYNFTGVTDGPSFFKKFCSGPLETTQPSSTPTEEEPTNPEQETPTATPQLLDKLPGYPKPVFLQSQYAVQGYYLDGSGYSDVAVLAIPNFGPEVAPGFNFTSGEAESQELLQNFFADARSKQKKRLIVDLRGNPGGKINLGFEVFKQLFPDLDPFGGSRYRANEAFGIMSSIFADAAENNTLKETDLELYNTIVDYAGPFNYQAIRNVNGSNFKTFDEYWGPYVNNGDNFTAIRRYNFSNPPNGYTLGANLNLTGYASEAPAPPQPFAAENIVILQDGICSSTCSIFSELMREQGHVHTIVVGGRPQTGPMQAIGGTKGAQVFNMDDIVGFSAKTLNFTEQLYGGSTREQVNKTAVGKLAATTQIYTRSSPLLPPDTPTGGTLNALDNLRMNDTQEIPLEFVYEAADCRLFNTLESIADVTKLWKLAVDAKWGDGKCVEGSTGDKTAISVADNVPFNNKNGTQSGNPPPQQFPGAASGLKTSGATMVVAALCVIVLLL